MTHHSPPWITVGTSSPGASSGWSPSRSPQRSRSARTASSTTVVFSIAFTAPPSRQSGCGISACPGRPCTVTVGLSTPRQAIQGSKPVASGTIPASASIPRAASASAPAPFHSSSVTVLTISSPASSIPDSATASAASTIAATPPFMSQAPRP